MLGKGAGCSRDVRGTVRGAELTALLQQSPITQGTRWPAGQGSRCTHTPPPTPVSPSTGGDDGVIAAEGVALPQEGQLLPLLLQETPARGSGELGGSSETGQGEQEPTTQEENAAPFTLHLEGVTSPLGRAKAVARDSVPSPPPPRQALRGQCPSSDATGYWGCVSPSGRCRSPAEEGVLSREWRRGAAAQGGPSGGPLTRAMAASSLQNSSSTTTPLKSIVWSILGGDEQWGLHGVQPLSKKGSSAPISCPPQVLTPLRAPAP